MKLNGNYKAVMEEEEEKLRWMIRRHRKLIELRYYLIFLLVASRRYRQAAWECKKVLALDRGNQIATAWHRILTTMRTWRKQAQASQVPVEGAGQGGWSHVGCSRSQCLL